jgi:DNA-binding Lrp family transcriptional regulator
VTHGSPDAPSSVPGRLDDRILSTLQELPGRLAFNGLKRTLGAHPESLARALRRLEREGLIERSEAGYRALRLEGPSPREGPAELRPIARIDLPPGVDPDLVRARLVGHWFGDLRWVGVVERTGGGLLVWARRDGTSPVLAGISKGVLRVYVPASEGATTDLGEAEEAAYELLAHAVAALRPSIGASAAPVSFLRSRAPEPARWPVEN